jgi:hypothetical protein
MLKPQFSLPQAQCRGEQRPEESVHDARQAVDVDARPRAAPGLKRAKETHHTLN